MAIQDYSGSAVPTVLAIEFDGSALSCTLSGDVSSWPTGGANGKFVVTFERGSDREERALVNTRVGNVLNFASMADRGVDGTAIFSHPAGTGTVEHTFSGFEAEDANHHIFDVTRDDHSQYMMANGTRHDLTARHPAGTVIPTAVVNGLVVGQAGAEGAGVNLARATHNHAVPIGSPVAVGTALADGATGDFADAGHVHTIDAAAGNLLVPVGSLFLWVASAAPSGYALCQGQAINRAANPILNALLAADGYPYGNGDGATTFNLPNLQQKFPLGKAAAGTGSVLGGTGGVIDHLHGLANNTAIAKLHHVGPPNAIAYHNSDLVGAGLWTSVSAFTATAVPSAVPDISGGVRLQGDTNTNNPPFIALNFIVKLG